MTNFTIDNNFVREWLTRIAIWIPITVGVIHQILMPFGFERIYVVIDPPGYVSPLISIEATWWILLVILSAGIFVFASTDRADRVPNRVGIPFYLYLLFLLIVVKPV
jgi:amino acid permease